MFIKKVILIFNVLGCSGLYGQFDIINLFDSSIYPDKTWNDKFKEVNEMTYNIKLKEDENLPTDTLIMIDGIKMYFTKSWFKRSYFNNNKLYNEVDINNLDGKISQIEFDSFDNLNRIISKKVLDESNSESNLETKIEYDKNGKISSVKLRQCENCETYTTSAIYRKDNDYEKVFIDGFEMGKITYTCKEERNKLVYEEEVHKKGKLSEFAKAMIKSKYKHYIERETNGEFYIYKSYSKRGKEKFRLDWEKMRDKYFRIYDSKIFANDNLIEHKKYSYNKFNQIETISDQIKNKVVTNKYNESGKPLEIIDSYYITKYSYDENGNWIKKVIYANSDEKPIDKVIIRDIKYK